MSRREKKKKGVSENNGQLRFHGSCLDQKKEEKKSVVTIVSYACNRHYGWQIVREFRHFKIRLFFSVSNFFTLFPGKTNSRSCSPNPYICSSQSRTTRNLPGQSAEFVPVNCTILCNVFVI